MHYEGLLRVPMIVKGPGVPAGKVVRDPVSTLDLGPTFCDWGKADPLLAQHGASLRPMIEGGAGRDFALNEWDLLPGRTGVRLSLRTVRTRDHKLTVDLISGAGEMYDLAADPGEARNLFGDPAHAGLQARLQGLLNRRPDDIGPEPRAIGMA